MLQGEFWERAKNNETVRLENAFVESEIHWFSQALEYVEPIDIARGR